MATITYEQIDTLIPNTAMEKVLRDGVHITYHITPVDGYVLRDQGRDLIDIDPITNEETTKFGYTGGMTSCAASYDFTTSIVTDENGVEHTAYGSRQFFARPETEVPSDQIFGVGNDHEVM